MYPPKDLLDSYLVDLFLLTKTHKTQKSYNEDNKVKLDKVAYKVYKQDTYIELTNKEFELLRLLLENRGRVLTRDNILKCRKYGCIY